MVTLLRPNKGGYGLKPFSVAEFIRDYLAGRGPQDSKRIDPDEGAPMVDIFGEYKTALLRAHAEDSVARDEELRVKKKLSPFTVEEAEERLRYYFDRIPYKFTRMKYSSFTRYFSHLKRLGWVEETGVEERSAIQEPAPGVTNPEGKPRVYYRLTDAGWKATPEEMSNPIRTLYPNFTKEYYEEKRRGRHYYTRTRR